ncbi:MAG: GNAT family N-acetyltransferase [Anaerolineales bacterium]
MDWLGSNPYFVLERNNRILSAMACPPDPPEIAWIRLFAVHAAISEREAWRTLWPATLDALQAQPEIERVGAIPLHGWFRDLLAREGFENNHNIVMLAWDGRELPEQRKVKDLNIRPMNFDDLPEVARIDHEAFIPIWRNSEDALSIAYRQASLATIAEYQEKMVGYQISTSNSMGGHLARLAVAPGYQGIGIGFNLVSDVLAHFKQRGANQVSVNTQGENLSSQALYKRIGFKYTGDIYPVYEFPLT